MKILQLFVAWWNAEPVTQRQRVNAHKAVPSDHFDKFGNYIFKDRSIGRLAGVAKSLGATMNSSVVQSIEKDSAGSRVTTLSFTGLTTTAGNLLMIVLSSTNGYEPTGITDTPGNTWSLRVDQLAAAGGLVLNVWTCPQNIGALVAGTITINFGANNPYTSARLYEITGANNASPVESISSAGASSGSTVISGTGAALSKANELIFGAMVVANLTSSVSSLTFTQGVPSTAYPSTTGFEGSTVLMESGFLVITSTTGQQYSGTLNASNGWAAACWAITLPHSAPSSPTLGNPANASYQDGSAGVAFGPNTYNSTDAANQNAYAMRIKVSGGTYNYWNVGTSALQSTIVWNADSVAPGGTWSVTLPAGILTNGNVYNWSFASQESLSNLQGPFATDFTFTAQAPPSVVVTAPTGSIAGNSPVVSWADTLAGGASQIDYQVIVESGAYGTVPGSGVSAWNSGVVASALASVSVGVTLTNAVTYRAFVQITETGGQVSVWGYSTFTVVVDVPAVPTITAAASNDPATGAPRGILAVNANDNQLTANQSSLEGNVTTGWSAGANTTIAASSTWAQDGSYSLAMTATAAGAVAASTPVGVSGVPVIAGQTARAMAYFHSPTTSRVCSVTIAFYNGATLLSTSTSPTANSTTTGGATGAQAFISMVVPVNATFATLILNGAALGAGEVLNADSMLVAPGSSTTWTKGGFVGTTTVTITRSDGVLVRGAGWEGSAAVPISQMITIYDYETISSHTYSAVVSTVQSGLTLTGAAGVSAAAGVVLSSWDIMDPTNPASYTKLEWAGDTRTFDRVEAQAVLTAFNRATDITVRGQLLNPSFDMSLNFGGDNDAAWQAFDALRSLQRTVMVRGDMAGDIFYVNLGGARPLVTARTGDRVNNPSRSLVIKTAPADRP
jgi:hypothetical protein